MRENQDITFEVIKFLIRDNVADFAMLRVINVTLAHGHAKRFRHASNGHGDNLKAVENVDLHAMGELQVNRVYLIHI